MRKGREEKTKFNHYMISIGNKKGFDTWKNPGPKRLTGSW
jgi:hypothetical protein